MATPNILHDSLSRITQDRANASGTTVQTHQYDEAGNRVARNGVGYGYDSTANNRLIAAEGKTYQFDVAGNVTSFTGVTAVTTADDGTVTGIETASGQTTYTRDYRNLRLTKAGAGGSGTFFYSPSGDLVQWTGPKYHGPNEWHCAQQNEVAEITPYENYVYAGGRRLANLRSRFFDCPISDDVLVIDNLYYYVSDKMDVPRAVYQASNNAKIWSAEFDAFGNPLGFVNEDPDSNCVYFSQPFRLPGQYALSPSEGGPTSTAGGLHENWHRIYDSTTGRYLQPDPFEKLPIFAPVKPYTYAEARPLDLIDPTGLYWCPQCDPSCPNVDDIGKRIQEVSNKITKLRTTKKCSGAKPGEGGQPIAYTDQFGTTHYTPLFYRLNPCIQCCADAHESKHRETTVFGLNLGVILSAENIGAANCYAIETIGYEAELFCLIDLEAGYNWQ